MGQRCHCCSHERRKALDAAILRGVPYLRIAATFDGVSEAGVRAHARDHLGLLLKDARLLTLNDLAQELLDMREAWLWMLAEALERHSIRDVYLAMQARADTVERLSKLITDRDIESRVKALEEQRNARTSSTY